MRKSVLLSMFVLVLALLSTQRAAAFPQPNVIPFEAYVITCGVVDPGEQWIEDGMIYIRNAQFYGEIYSWERGGTLSEDPLPMFTGDSAVTLYIDGNLSTNQAQVFSTYTLDPSSPAIDGIWNGLARGTFTDFPATRDGEFYYGANGSGDLFRHHLAAVSNSMPIEDLPIPVCDGTTPRSARYMEGIMTYPPGR